MLLNMTSFCLELNRVLTERSTWKFMDINSDDDWPLYFVVRLFF